MKKLLYLFIVCFFLFSFSKENTNETKEVIGLIKIANQNIDVNITKAIYYIDKALEYKNKLDSKTLLDLYESSGKIYRANGEYLQSLNFFKEQLELQKTINKEDSYYIYNEIGIVYTRLNETKLARDNFSKSLQGLQNQKTKKNEALIYNVFNNIAVLELNNGNVVKALEIFAKCKDLSKKNKDYQGLVMAYQNISIANAQLKEYDIALDYFYKAKYLAKKHNLNFDYSSISFNLGFLFNHNIKNLDSAKYYFRKSYELANKFQFPMIIKGSAHELALIYEKEKDFEKANFFLRVSKEWNEKEIKEQNKKKIDQLEFGYNQKINQQEVVIREKRNLFIFIISSVFLISLVFVSVLMYRLQKNKLKVRTIEKNLLAKKIEDKNKELTSKTIEIMKVGEIIDATHKGLTELKANPDLATESMLSKIIHYLKTDIKGFNKQEFDKLFIETNAGFYKNLLTEFPNLTKNDLRLCAFLKMNLSTKEISAITNQSTNSIVIARHRLRKKLDISNEKQNLVSFLSRFY